MSWALVTGASAGLGVEFARLCAKDGHSLFLVARRKDRLEELATELREKYPKIRVEVVALDLSARDSARELYAMVQKMTPDLDILINNAGFGTSGSFSDISLERELEMMDLNMCTLVALTGQFLPRMKSRMKGRILNVGSTAGFQPGPYMATYYATKAFVNSFSEAIHEELKDTGVTCTVLAPGPVHTEFGKIADVNSSRLFKGASGLTAEEVACAGYKGMCAGQALVVPGLSNKLIPQMLRVSPRSFVRKTVGWLNRSVQ